MKHDWYRDGVASDDGNRLCRKCRFREQLVGDMECFGSSDIHTTAFAEGHSTGIAFERQRIKAVLGLGL